MFQVSQEQMDTFDGETMKAYRHRIREHLDKHFPDYSKALIDEHLQALIDHAVERGEVYGVDSERDICLWVDLMLVLSVDFDEVEEYLWAKEILTDESSPQPNVRMDTLHARAVEVIEEREAEATS